MGVKIIPAGQSLMDQKLIGNSLQVKLEVPDGHK